MSFLTWLKDTLERVATTFVQAFLVIYIGSVTADPIASPDGGHQLVDLGVAKIALVAGLAAAYTVLKSALLQNIAWSAVWQDYVFRAASTFVITAGAIVTADGFNVFNVDGWQTAALAGAAAVLALIKGWISLRAVKGTVTPLSLAKAA
jgi:hypothetical protein